MQWNVSLVYISPAANMVKWKKSLFTKSVVKCGLIRVCKTYTFTRETYKLRSDVVAVTYDVYKWGRDVHCNGQRKINKQERGLLQTSIHLYVCARCHLHLPCCLHLPSLPHVALSIPQYRCWCYPPLCIHCLLINNGLLLLFLHYPQDIEELTYNNSYVLV